MYHIDSENNRQMDDLGFTSFFKGNSAISGQWTVDNERLCAMEFRGLRSKRSSSQAGLEPRTARAVGKRLTY